MSTEQGGQSKFPSGSTPAFRSFRTSGFKKQFDALPADIREAAAKQFKVFLQNPFHPLLRRHSLYDVDDAPPDSFAVAMAPGGYRAVAFQDGDDYVWYWCGPHGRYDIRFRKGR